VQDTDPKSEYLPATQLVQTVSADAVQAESINFPAPHTVQVEEQVVATAVVVSYFPAPQAVQTDAVDAVQAVAINLPALQAEQVEHAEVAVRVVYVPSAQGVQASVSPVPAWE
jgi:hypothetical protein